MRSSLEIDKKDYGFVVETSSYDGGEDGYTFEELALEDPLDVIAEVLHWLGYHDEVARVMEILAEDEETYALTDKGLKLLEQLEREKLEADNQLEREKVQAAKRGGGRGAYWHNTTRSPDSGTWPQG